VNYKKYYIVKLVENRLIAIATNLENVKQCRFNYSPYCLPWINSRI